MDNNGLQGKLVDAGLLGIGRDADNEADTRAYSNLGRFMWMPKELTETGGIKIIAMHVSVCVGQV